MKLVGTRIRVEKSEHKTEYFPEYCLEENTWFGLGKVKRGWYGVTRHSTHKFCEARIMAEIQLIGRYSEEWAKKIIDYQAHYWEEYLKEQDHQDKKEITYVKYP